VCIGVFVLLAMTTMQRKEEAEDGIGKVGGKGEEVGWRGGTLLFRLVFLFSPSASSK